MTSVALWRIPFQASDADFLLLSEDERERAARFHFAPDRDAWTAARAGLRRALAETLDCGPQDVRFARAPGGKPRLASDADHARVRFSLSHTARRALAAVTTDGTEVGVDIERIRRDFDLLALAPSIMAPDEFLCLQDIPEASRPALFFALWTAKEAVLKAEGQGLFISPASFSVLPVWERQETRARGFRIQTLPAGDGYAAALAVPETNDGGISERGIVWHELCITEHQSHRHNLHP